MARESRSDDPEESAKTRKEVLRSRGGTNETESSSNSRRTFLGGAFVSALSALGLDGITGTASASPDPKSVANVLEDRREFFEVLVENDVVHEEVLEEVENPGSRSLLGRSSIAATVDEETGRTVITFPEESDQIRLEFGDELTDLFVSLPDDVDGEALTEEINEKVSGLTNTSAVNCCNSHGYCDITKDRAKDVCSYRHFFPPMECGSYSCGMVPCECQDPDGNCTLDWCCDCCGAGHGWCGTAPSCSSSNHC